SRGAGPARGRGDARAGGVQPFRSPERLALHRFERPALRRMIHLTKALIRRWLDALLHIDDAPERTAAAFALGVFFGFSPFLGFHTILGIVFAFLFNLNRVAVLLGVYSNLPIVIAPYYAFVTMTASRIAGHRPPPGFGSRFAALFDRSIFSGDFWHQLIITIRPLVWPY